MAIINCEICGKEISDKAKKCPHCGAERNVVVELPTIICSECGANIPADSVDCPNCGCPVLQENKAANSEPQKVEISKISVNKNTKKVIISIIAILAAIILIGGIILIAKNARDKKDAEDAAQAYSDNLRNYKSTLALARTTMLTGAANAEKAGTLIHDVWYNAIYEKRDSTTDQYTRPRGYFESDFNTALSNLFSSYTFSASIDTIESNQETVASLMKKLVNPPEEYKEAYSAIRDLYGAYTDLCNCAVNPTGNLQSYTNTFNTADTDFMKYYNALDMYLD